MPRASSRGTSPNWSRLYEQAASQGGYVTLRQAAEAGYSPPLVQYYVRQGKLERAGRGQLRLVHFPPTEHEDLVPLWLWSEKEGVFSHETGLMLHQLSDAMPARRFMTLPTSWAKRRLRVPKGLVLHFANLPSKDTTWSGPVPVTIPLRTVSDCSAIGTQPDLVRQAVNQGVRRGLFTRGELQKAMREKRGAK